jgi:hypothetical protein
MISQPPRMKMKSMCRTFYIDVAANTSAHVLPLITRTFSTATPVLDTYPADANCPISAFATAVASTEFSFRDKSLLIRKESGVGEKSWE